MKAAEHKNVVQPIALRKDSQESHPLSDLQQCRSGFAAKAEELGRALADVAASDDEITKLIPSAIVKKITLETNDPLNPHAISRSEKFLVLKPGFEHEVIVLLDKQIDKLLLVKRLLNENEATSRIPQLQDLKRSLSSFTGQSKWGAREVSPTKEYLELHAQDAQFRDRLKSVETRIRESLAALSPDTRKAVRDVTAYFSCKALAADRNAVPIGKTRKALNTIRKSATPEDTAILDQINCVLDELNQINRDRKAYPVSSKELETLAAEIGVQFNRILTKHQAVFRNFDLRPEGGKHSPHPLVFRHSDYSLKELCIVESYRSILGDALTSTEPSRSSFPNADRRLPAVLVPFVKNVGVNEAGELISVRKKLGDPGKLVEKLASLIENHDPAIYAGNRINSHLAPVIRAALPRAQELVEQRAAESTRLAHEQKLVTEAAERAKNEIHATEAASKQTERDLIVEFINDTFSTTIPSEVDRHELGRKMMAVHPDLNSIHLRFDTLGEVASRLSYESSMFREQVECWLLDETGLAAWSTKVLRLRNLALKSLGKDAYLITADPSNFLPSVIDDALANALSKTESA